MRSAEIPSGADRGSTVPIVGTPTPSSAPGKPHGAQAEPARFSSNGQIPHNTVPSPSGALPVGAVATSQEHADQLVAATNAAHDAFVKKVDKRLDPATVNRLGHAELRAIGDQRGYKLSAYMGARAMRAAFLEAQSKDTNLTQA